MKKKKRIGILTFHKAINYGGVLQCYALQKKLISMGQMAEIINYNSKDVYSIYDYFYLGKYNIIKTPIRLLLNIIYFPKNIMVKNRFKKFIEEYIQVSKPITNIEELKKSCKEYDIIISGSDQVWNKEITKSDYRVYDLSLMQHNNKISYAASIGRDKLTDADIKYYKELINDYRKASVREESLKKILGDNVAQVMDPVFLLDKTEWKKAKSKIIIKNKYIFVFSLQQNKAINQIIDELSSKYKIYYYCKIPILKKNVTNVYGMSPNEFLSMIDNAEMVVTNSFHCLAFAIIFNKNFISVLHKDKSSRQVDLLTKVGLLSRIYNTNLAELMSNEIKYEEVNNRIKQEVDSSIKYLEDAINN